MTAENIYANNLERSIGKGKKIRAAWLAKNIYANSLVDQNGIEIMAAWPQV